MLAQRRREKDYMNELFEKQRNKIHTFLLGASQKKKKEEDFYEEIKQKIHALRAQPEKRESSLGPWMDLCRNKYY